MAGADAVQVGTATFRDPGRPGGCSTRSGHGAPGVRSVRTLRGAAHGDRSGDRSAPAGMPETTRRTHAQGFAERVAAAVAGRARCAPGSTRPPTFWASGAWRTRPTGCAPSASLCGGLRRGRPGGQAAGGLLRAVGCGRTGRAGGRARRLPAGGPPGRRRRQAGRHRFDHGGLRRGVAGPGQPPGRRRRDHRGLPGDGGAPARLRAGGGRRPRVSWWSAAPTPRAGRSRRPDRRARRPGRAERRGPAARRDRRTQPGRARRPGDGRCRGGCHPGRRRASTSPGWAASSSPRGSGPRAARPKGRPLFAGCRRARSCPACPGRCWSTAPTWSRCGRPAAEECDDRRRPGLECLAG